MGVSFGSKTTEGMRQMFAGRLREVGHRVAGDDQGGVGLAAAERVGGGVLARIEPRVAARRLTANG